MEKNYKTYYNYNKTTFTVEMLVNGSDGKGHSVCFQLPQSEMVYNKKEKIETRVKLSVRTLTKRALEMMAKYYSN